MDDIVDSKMVVEEDKGRVDKGRVEEDTSCLEVEVEVPRILRTLLLVMMALLEHMEPSNAKWYGIN